MTTRLTLLCAGATRSMRLGCFPDPAEPLDDGGRAKVRALPCDWPEPARAYVSPAAAARETAHLLGVAADHAAALADQDAGAWAGLGPDAIGEAAFARWLATAGCAAPGGENMAAVRARVGAWLDALEPGRVLAVTHAAVIRAAVAHALDAPDAITLGIDIAPLSRVMLSRHTRWRVQALLPG